MESFLTGRQLEILKLRQAGKTQGEIAKLLGTSRENISIAEKRAKENVRKARKTLEEYERITAIEIDLQDISDIVKIPRTIFEEADKHSIKVTNSATEILESVEDYIENTGQAPEKAHLLASGKALFE